MAKPQNPVILRLLLSNVADLKIQRIFNLPPEMVLQAVLPTFFEELGRRTVWRGVLLYIAARLERGAGELIAMRKSVKLFSEKKRKRKKAKRLHLAASGGTGACVQSASSAGIMPL